LLGLSYCSIIPSSIFSIFVNDLDGGKTSPPVLLGRLSRTVLHLPLKVWAVTSDIVASVLAPAGGFQNEIYISAM
jgi:hypothetical protein